jgi:flagellar M-ring protein FliF
MLTTLQKQFLTYWAKQSRSQRLAILALGLALAILVPVLVSWANTPSYVVAYSGLSETDAAQITQNLDENNIPYQLKNSGTIMVESSQVYAVRLKMASAGLPQNSTVGFELFDGNSLGMTEFSQKVNYQRALEGELERTISNISAVESVSVHIVTPEKSLLTTTQTTTTASVTVLEKAGLKLDKSQVRAITHLVASSVEGLKPENVVVVDGEGVMLANGTDDVNNSSSQVDSQRAAESSAADDIRRRVQAMLDLTLGPNKSIVQASVAMDWTQREVTSSSFDPTPAAVRSSQKINEAYNTNGVPIGGIPGAASNLPTPVPTVTGVPAGTIYYRNEETLNYEISQVDSKETVPAGQVERVSVSVMVDNVTDAEQLKSIKTAVSAAAGIDETRGDLVVVEAMAFDRTYADAQAAENAKQEQTDLYMQIGIAVAALVVVIILFVFFQRSMRNLRRASREAWKPILQPVSQLALDSAGMGVAQKLAAGMQASQQLSAGKSGKDEDADVRVEISSRHPQRSQEELQRATIIKKLAEENPASVAEVIQVWLNGEDNRNG